MTDTRQLLSIAVGHHQAGRLTEAEAAYRAILARDPDHADSHNLLGVLSSQSGYHDTAIAFLTRAIALAHGRVPGGRTPAEYHNNLGLALRAAGRPDDAVGHYRQALAQKPDYAAAYLNLGAALEELGAFDEAAAAFDALLRLKPDHPKGQYALGNVLKAQGRLNEAEKRYERAIALKPDYAEAFNNLGLVLKMQGRLDEAAAAYGSALAINPDYANAHYNLGIALYDLGRLDEALAHYRQALAAMPDNADIHWNLALLHLLRGEFAVGWSEYEWRWLRTSFKRPDFVQPLWDGRAHVGTILLQGEQGLGDQIQFARYAAMVRATGNRAVLEVSPPLAGLLSNLDGVDQVMARGQPLPLFDAYCSLMSLPHIFGTEIATIPRDVPYLAADPAKVAEWAPALAGMTGLKIGLVWAGSTDNTNDRSRSMKAETLLALANTPGASFFSLQFPIPAHDETDVTACARLHRTPDKIANFEDAAIIAQLDLVIAVDTATAHVAAAMGKPVWILLHDVPDWRWMLDRDDSPWYPTVRLFRQTRRGDWTDVIGRVKSALSDLIASHAPCS